MQRFWYLVSLLWLSLPLWLRNAVAVAVAEVIFLFWRERKANMLDNMAHVLAEDIASPRVRRLARRSLRNYCRAISDFPRLLRLNRTELDGLVHFQNWEGFDRALAKGKGVIFVGFHMGNWDLAAAAIARRGYPLHVIVDTFSAGSLNGFIQGCRNLSGLEVIPLAQAKRNMLPILRAKEMLGILIDRPSVQGGVPVQFFGAPAWVPAGPAMLALRTGASIVTGCAVRESNNSFRVIDHYIDYAPSGQLQRDIRALSQQIVNSLEALVRRYPDQWYMFRRMWPAVPSYQNADAPEFVGPEPI